MLHDKREYELLKRGLVKLLMRLRTSAYNDMCYLCEKYAPLEGFGKYNPQKDPSVTGASIAVHT